MFPKLKKDFSLVATEEGCCKSPSETAKQPCCQETPPTSPRGTKTKIVIKLDCGFSNCLFLRGKGANLSWDKGIALKNVSSDLWTWETAAPFNTLEFKVLLNDQVYETGENHTVACGDAIEYTPQF